MAASSSSLAREIGDKGTLGDDWLYAQRLSSRSPQLVQYSASGRLRLRQRPQINALAVADTNAPHEVQNWLTTLTSAPQERHSTWG